MTTENALDVAIKKGMKVYVGGYRYSHFHWYTNKREAQNDAKDARQFGFNARVVPKHGGWSLVIRRK